MAGALGGTFLPFPIFLETPSGGAATAEGQGAVSAIDMDGGSGARSRPAKIIKGAKKAAYYPKNFAQRLASPLFLPAASSYHEVLAVAQLDKAVAAD